MVQHEIMKDLFQKVYDIKPSNQISNDEADSVASAIHRIYSKYLFRDKIAYKYESDGTWEVDSVKMFFVDQVYFKLAGHNKENFDLLLARLCSDIFGNIEGIGECSAKNDGEMRKGDFHNPFWYAYDSLQGKWIASLDDPIDVACVSSKLGAVRKREATYAFAPKYQKCILNDGEYYWTSADSEEEYIEYGTKGLECDSLGRVQKLSVDPNFYVVCEEGKFRKAN